MLERYIDNTKKDTIFIMGNFVRCSILRHNGGIYSIRSQLEDVTFLHRKRLQMLNSILCH